MKKRVFAVIDSRSINNATRLRELVEDCFEKSKKIDFELMIEVNPKGIDYVPVSEEIRAKFPVINRAFVHHLVVHY